MAADLALQPHHDGSALYVSTAHPKLGDVVRVRVRIPEGFGPVLEVRTRSNPDHEPRFAVAAHVANVDGWDWWEAEIEVENPVHGYRFLLTLADGGTAWLNATGLHHIETLDGEDFRLVAGDQAPDWAAGAVMYQVFPDRFARSAAADTRPLPDWAIPARWSDEVVHVGPDVPYQFYGGDLAGVEEHLDHLVELGVTLLYLTPVFPAQSNHRYDALSFDVVDPLLGGDEALVSLVRAAHERGIRVIGDLTTNHSGDAHEWFVASHEHPEAPESPFYYWLDDGQRHYVSWLGVPSLPKFDWNSPELRRRFIDGPDSVVAKWLKPPYSFDGWRIDVSNMTGRYLGEDLNQTVRRTIRSTMHGINPDTLLIGESTNDAAPDFPGDAWHGAMTYANFTRPVWGWLSEPGAPALGGLGMALGRIPAYTGEQVYQAHVRFTAAFPWKVRMHNLNALDTHDTPRFLTSARAGTVPVAFGLAVTLPGIPLVFAGDEFGLTGEDGEHSRTPMPWDRVQQSRETIDLYSSLIRLRTGHRALAVGGIRWLHVGRDVLVFVRETAQQSVLVVAARDAVEVLLPPHAVAGLPVTLFGEVGAVRTHAGLELSTEGPAFGAFALPGVSLPDFASPGTVLGLE